MIKDPNELLKILEEKHDECLIKLNGSLDKKSETLYHYTDLNAALAILENATLRFTDIKYCNDPQEIEDGLRIFNKVTEELFSYYHKQSPLFTYLISHIRHTLNLSTSFTAQESERLIQAKKELEKFGVDSTKFSYKKSSVFVCCLSQRSDDLRQWLPYANNGLGVALGFQGLDNNHNITEDDAVWAVKVCYKSEEKKEEYVRDLFKNTFEIFSNMDANLIPIFVEAVYQGIFFDIIACKSENYKDEEEWRLIYIADTNSALEKINFRISDNIIRPYIDVSVVKNSIIEIKLGPKTEDRLNIHALTTLLNKWGYTNTNFTKSKISYR